MKLNNKQLDQIGNMVGIVAIAILAFFTQWDIAVYGIVSLGLGKAIIDK